MCPALDSPCFIDRRLGNVTRHGGFFPCCEWHGEGPVPDRFLPLLQCTVSCGGGVQTRSVHCVQQGRPSSSCLLRQKPPVLRACNTNFCPAPAKRGKGPRLAQVGFPPVWSICPTPAKFSYVAPAQTLGGAIHITVDIRGALLRVVQGTYIQGSPRWW